MAIRSDPESAERARLRRSRLVGDSRDVRRTRALIRDDERLRVALAEHEKRRFDVDTARMVKYRVEDLLETVGLIAQDDDFWNRLENADHPPSSEQLERVKRIDP